MGGLNRSWTISSQSKEATMMTVGKIREICRMLVVAEIFDLMSAAKIAWPYAHLGNDVVVEVDPILVDWLLRMLP